MTEKEELLQDLKIDRSKPAEDKTIQSNKFLLFGLATIIILFFGWFFLSEDQAKIVTTFTVKSLNTNNSSVSSILDASGYVVARRRATVSSKITGKVMKVFVEEGMYVKEGQLLAQLDDSTMVADLNYSLSQLKEAKRVLNRTQELASRQLASQASLDAAQTFLEGLEALTEVKRQTVEDMKIVAPFSGVVVYKAAQPGEMISPISAGGGFTKTGICTIVDMDSLEVEVDVNEAFINRVIPGQPVIANLNAYSEWDIPAKVIAIIPTANRSKATVKVRIALLEKDKRVLPDMGIRVSFLKAIKQNNTTTKKEGVMVPNAAVALINNELYVQVVSKGKIKLKKVNIIEESSNYSRVTSGLSAGVILVAKFDNSLKEDQKVKIN
jgi:RND family efflux transporter MFP subunit